MNSTDVFFNNGQLNWDAISTISNIILVFTLIVVTWRYAKQVKKQTEFMKKDRLAKEMDKLVAPLHSKIGDTSIFLKGVPHYNVHGFSKRDPEYSGFWDEIKRNKYLAPDYLRSAVNNYFKNKSNEPNERTRDTSYEKAESELFEAIEKRHDKLQYELEEKTWIKSIKNGLLNLKLSYQSFREKS